MRRAKRTFSSPDREELVAAPPLSLRILWRDGWIAQLCLGRAEVDTLAPDASDAARGLHAALRSLAAGRPEAFPPLPLDWERVPSFSRKVLRALYEHVPAGVTVTYGELAALAGEGGKARAVGQVMARNPWPLVVPCHRVLGGGGALTGYTNPHGLDLKELLLSLEGAHPADGGR